MQTIFPYQVRFAIGNLTRLADELEAADIPEWFALASAAACLEKLLRGETPSDIADISARLKDLAIPHTGARRCGKTTALAISMAQTIIDGHRLGLLIVKTEIHPFPRLPVWIGIDLSSGPDKTVWSARHAG